MKKVFFFILSLLLFSSCASQLTITTIDNPVKNRNMKVKRLVIEDNKAFLVSKKGSKHMLDLSVYDIEVKN
jgi:uncharacterized protein YcfL